MTNFFFITVVYIKEELEDAFDVNIQNQNPSLNEVDGFNEAMIANEDNQIVDRDDSTEEITIKEEPLPDDLVS